MALFRVLLELRRVWDSRVGVRVRASWPAPRNSGSLLLDLVFADQGFGS